MAKKGKERSETEYLRAINKKLQAELRTTKRALSRYEKRSHLYEQDHENEEEKEFEEKAEEFVKVNSCPECFKGSLTSSDLGIRKLITCNNCTYKKIIK